MIRLIWIQFLKMMLIQNLDFSKIALTHYNRVLLSIPPENTRKPLGFLMFSGDIEKQHRAVMGQKIGNGIEAA